MVKLGISNGFRWLPVEVTVVSTRHCDGFGTFYGVEFIVTTFSNSRSCLHGRTSRERPEILLPRCVSQSESLSGPWAWKTQVRIRSCMAATTTMLATMNQGVRESSSGTSTQGEEVTEEGYCRGTTKELILYMEPRKDSDLYKRLYEARKEVLVLCW